MAIKHNQNHHFIQKAYAKNFANKNGELKWIKYKTKESGVFNINDLAKDQPISKKLFYSLKLEKRVNSLENDGMLVINKIINQSENRNKISLNRKDLITLKFYLILLHSRTDKIRNNIKNRDGDIIFKKIVDISQKDEKEIQEQIMNQIMDEFEKCKNDNFVLKLNEFNNLLTNFTIEGAVNMNIVQIMQSRVNIIKFNRNKLLLNEAGMFIEYNRKTFGNLLSFFPLSPNIGLCLYYNPVEMRNHLNFLQEKSIIFNNDVSKYNHEIKYVNKTKIIQEQLKNGNNYLFEKFIKPELHDKEDKFIYEVLMENEEVLDTCNGMMLVHNQDQIIIYQNEEDIKDAEEMIKNKNIYRK